VEVRRSTPRDGPDGRDADENLYDDLEMLRIVVIELTAEHARVAVEAAMLTARAGIGPS
jgi:hypothetical protein